MSNLSNALTDLLNNKERYYVSNDGDAFESQVKKIFKKHGLTELVVHEGSHHEKEIADTENIDIKVAKDLWTTIKKRSLKKDSIEKINNPFSILKNFFVFQPNGSQNFPDFLVFTNESVIPIEIKYSQQNKKKYMSSRPMWNSNIPKASAIYIFGVASSDLTMFLGSDILPHDTRMSLNNFFSKMNKDMSDVDDKIKEYGNRFGLYPYVRKAFDHKAKKSTYVDEKGNKKVESYFSKNRVEREKNVIDFIINAK